MSGRLRLYKKIEFKNNKHDHFLLETNNGRVLIFYRETKTNDKGEGFSAKLWSIDLTGYNERLVNTPTDASDPSWSSLLSN